MPLYPHSILKKPKDVKVDGDVRREPDVVKTTEIDVENDVFDRPAAQPGNKIFRGLPFREQSRSFNVAFGAFLCFLLQSKQCNRGKNIQNVSILYWLNIQTIYKLQYLSSLYRQISSQYVIIYERVKCLTLLGAHFHCCKWPNI